MYLLRQQLQTLTISYGKYDHIPEDAFRLVGSMDDVIAKAKDMGVEV